MTNDVDTIAADVQLLVRDSFKRSRHYAEFYRDVFGPGGIIDTVYPSAAARAQFERSPAYTVLQAMIEDLRRRPSPVIEQRVITVRMPAVLHTTLQAEAAKRGVSLNTLCIARLLR